jgi:hypothetical protein
MSEMSEMFEMSEIIDLIETFPEIDEEEYSSKLSLVSMKVQSGKTGVCAKYITSRPMDFHIVVTMNTINANDQFFSRMMSSVGENNIIVVNSKPQSTHGNYFHVKQFTQIPNIILKNPNIKLVIFCANPTRFTGLPSLVQYKINLIMHECL